MRQPPPLNASTSLIEQGAGLSEYPSVRPLSAHTKPREGEQQ
jgi:hypothetical protein